jgi:hypothetical protein
MIALTATGPRAVYMASTLAITSCAASASRERRRTVKPLQRHVCFWRCAGARQQRIQLLLGAAFSTGRVSVTAEQQHPARHGTKIEEWIGIRLPDRETEPWQIQQNETERDRRELLNGLRRAEDLWKQTPFREKHSLALRVSSDKGFIFPRRSADECDAARLAPETESSGEYARCIAGKGRALIDHSNCALD